MGEARQCMAAGEPPMAHGWNEFYGFGFDMSCEKSCLNI
jgi:hypothetical protein